MNEIIEITNQGAILIDSSSIPVISEKIVAITINTKSTYGQIMHTPNKNGYPSLILEATKHSSQLHACKRSEPTELFFPDYFGWSIFSAQYTNNVINVCLTKNQEL
jgi:hypothetical protein